MNIVKVRLTATQLNRLRDIVPNIHDYFDYETGELAKGCEAYKFGMRTPDELRALEAKLAEPRRGSAATLHLTETEARVLEDRLEFAWEIASENGEWDAAEARWARSYRAGIHAINAALVNAGYALKHGGKP